ncbi:DUF808 domain-containing protein [Corynebacterium tapiri]|uniref:DUF808 domain-containing protein n=1 Tax=Corynebacterium tapiri TaxID=1448266 RepID=A0A5C4U705_9CORY|nr:DUF808 domain-containing protein [Corynebacterium tapiri]TNM00544.1 DUF808 domain-containing protein [Corynebacterium tapiri]
MAGGLLALFDDVALIARTAAANMDDVAALTGKTTAKSAGVVIDDAAVTPGYLEGASPQRELPMIWRITKGSLINKLVIILPIALLLSWLAPWALMPILMIGGTYLCYEGAHKVIHAILHKLGKGHEEKATPVADAGPDAEDKLVKSAIRTDLILSAEIMVISLNSVIEETFAMRLAVLVIVAIVITLAVYGAVALLVKLDDIGLGMVKRGRAAGFGRGLVKAMPIVLNAISIIGTFAMLWVGGHIITKGLADTGLWHWPYETAHHFAEAAGGGFLGWAADTAFSLVVGAIWGTIVYFLVEAVKAVLPGKKSDGEHVSGQPHTAAKS